MSLPTELIKQFVEVTKVDTKSQNEDTVYGVIKEYDNKTYVAIDGSDQLTPVETTAVFKTGERVIVSIKNHIATVTGNVSSPSARNADVESVTTRVDEFEGVLAEQVTTEQLNAQIARIDDLEVTDVTINGKLAANTASINNLSTNKIDTNTANATFATITNLNATNAAIDTLEADYGEFELAVSDRFSANEASISNLQANKLSANDIEGKYANIDFSNISNATMEYFYSNSGLIKNVIIGDTTITGELVGVTISGDLLKGDTVIADKLVIKGEDGLYYKLNTDGVTTEAEQTEYNSLNGDIITAQSITASKINVDDLVAFDATIGGFNITDNSIYSGVKTSVNNTTRGVYLDNDGQVVFGDASNFMKYYRDTDGKYKLEISADSVLIGNNSIATAINEVIETTQTNATDLANYISSTNAELDSLQGQIDGSITTWFYEYVPTTSNIPASDWITTALKNNHLGDLFYDTLTGYCYRWQVKNNAYSWIRITDVDVTKALADAATAQTTADNKRRVFVSTPTPPYDIGDLWVQGTAGDLMRCKTTKTASQSYVAADWVKASKYTDDTAANAAQADADALAVRMSSAETTISKNKDEIALRATISEVETVANNLADNYYTKKQADSALTVKANEITSTVSSTYATQTALSAVQETADAAQQSVDNLEIGGRNYLLSTSNEWSNEVSFTGWQAYVLNSTPAGCVDLVGQTVTFSGYVRTVTGGNVGMMLHVDTPDKPYGYHQVIALENDFVTEGNEGYISRTATLPSDVTNITGIRLALRHYSSTDPDSVAQYKGWKLEKGSKATDWSPAPEDLATGRELDAVVTRVSAAETTITQHTDAILLRATSDEVSTAKSEAISAAASDATTKANNALASAKSYADAQIEISADSITSTVNSVRSTANSALTAANAAQKQVYHTAEGESGVAGYAAIAQIIVNNNYVNSPVLFGLTDRGKQSSNVSFCLNSVDNTDPSLSHLQTDGNMRIWAYKADTSTWEIIVQKSEAWDEIYVNDFANPRHGITVNWIDKLYSELPTENIYEATVLAAKMAKSVIDNLGTRLTSAETNITQTANAITSVASRTTTAETKISTLEQTADGFTASLATTNANVTTAQNTANTANTNATNAAKTATNYLNYSSSGLVVGDMTTSSLGKNVLIDSDSVDIRNGSTVLASFGADTVTLGRNAEDSKIDLCNGAGTISANTAQASTSYPHRNAILIESQEIETESVRFVASTSNAYGATSTPSIQRGTELYMTRSSGSGESAARLKAEHKTTSSGAYTNAGVSAMCYDSASTTRLLAYASDSANGKYNNLNLYPTKATLNKPLFINGTEFTGSNKVLWSGGYYMSDSQTATLSAAISDQANGIVLIWSYYVDGASDNSNFQCTYIPKHFITLHPGKGIAAVLTNGTMNIMASKYVYVSDTSIKGYAGNADAATNKDSGVTSTSKNFVLRYVIGV